MTNSKFLKIAVAGVTVAAIAIGIGVGVGVKNKKSKEASASNSAQYDACRRRLVVPGIEDEVIADAPLIRRKLLARRVGELSEIAEGWGGDAHTLDGTKVPTTAPTPPTAPAPLTPPTALTPVTPTTTTPPKGSKGTAGVSFNPNGTQSPKGTKGPKGTNVGFSGSKGTKGPKGANVGVSGTNTPKGPKGSKSQVVRCYWLSVFCSNCIKLNCFSHFIPNQPRTGLCCRKAR